MIGVLTVAVLVVNAFQGVYAFLGSGDMTWVAWELTILCSLLIVSIRNYQNCSYSDTKKKLVELILLCSASFTFASYVALSIGLGSKEVYAILALISLYPIVPWLSLKSYLSNSSRYSKKGSYLVYKRPNSVLGLVAISLALKPPGVALVIDGVEYSFAGESFGQLAVCERAHLYNRNNRYKKIRDADVEHARQLVGTRWTPGRSCLRIFARFDKPPQHGQRDVVAP